MKSDVRVPVNFSQRQLLVIISDRLYLINTPFCTLKIDSRMLELYVLDRSSLRGFLRVIIRSYSTMNAIGVRSSCRSHAWSYMSFRFWIGTWITMILVILVAFDASACVCYITRFTEENFATLIAFIFIYKVFSIFPVLIFRYLFDIIIKINRIAIICDACTFPQAVENVLSIGKKYPLNTHSNEIAGYNCWCKQPNITLSSSYDYVNWTSLDKTVCEVTMREVKCLLLTNTS